MKQPFGTQRLDTTIRDVVWGILTGEVNVSMPGEVVSYDAITQTASIQPVFNAVFEDGVEQQLPILQDVPVFFPGGGGFVMTFPIVEGDTCLLVFAQRSLDAWIEKGTLTAPDGNRKFSLSDAVAFVGLNHSKNVISPAPASDGIELRTRDQGTFLKVIDGAIRIQGDVTVTGKLYAADCIAQTSPTVQVKLGTHTHPTGMGPSGAPTATPGVTP